MRDPLGMEAYALFVTFGVKPEEYLGLKDGAFDRIHLRAFLLACLSKYQEDTGAEEPGTSDNGLTMSPEEAQRLIEERRGR